jgi:predicted nucleic acid-binding protein
MNESLVVDASAMIAILRSEPERDAVVEILRVDTQAGTNLLAPAGFWIEIVNSLVRRHRWSSAQVLQGLQAVDRFGIRGVDVDRPILLLTLDLAERFGLTSYDASYLAVAISQRAKLLTLDADLASAAGERAVALGGSPRLHETPAAYEHDVAWPGFKGASTYLAQLRAEVLAGRPR